MPRRPPDSIPHQRARGRLSLGFARQPRGTVLDDLFQSSPLRALFPDPEPDEAITAAVVNTAGGLAGGDAIEVAIRAGEGAVATVSAPAAEKVYRSLGEPTRIATTLSAAAGARLEWIPQETIVFDGARLERRINVDLAGDARLLMAEVMVFGRTAHGETLTNGTIRDAWRLRRDGALVWADGLLLERDLAACLAAPFGFGAAQALGTLLYAGEGAEGLVGTLREGDREWAAPGGVTVSRPGLLLGRWLGGALAVRRSVSAAMLVVRAAAMGQPARLPRLWTT